VDILNPRAAYPSGKRAAETLCASYGDQFGTDTVIVRPGHVYGPGVKESDTRASADFSRRAARGEAIIMKSAGAQLRSYCYALDCASALITVLIAGKSGEAYNISNRDSVVSIRDMAEALAEAGGVPVRFENPSDLEKKGYNLMDNSGLDASKLEALGWKACFSLAEGAKSTVEGLRNEQ
jgi:nucleoside-diphosphate-sugar epimerase